MLLKIGCGQFKRLQTWRYNFIIIILFFVWNLNDNFNSEEVLEAVFYFIDIWQFGLEIMELFTVSIVGAYVNPQGKPFIYIAFCRSEHKILQSILKYYRQRSRIIVVNMMEYVILSHIWL